MYTIIMFEKHLGKFSWYIVLFLSLVYHNNNNNNNNNNNFKASSKVFVILKYFVKLYTQILFFRELLVKV